jgi:serine/threonine-protein kinase
VKVADFGLCRDQEAEQVDLTQPGVTMGTPSYMSPEQAQGQKLDHRSDLYSLGVTFYYMLAGVPPFRGDTALALAIKHVKETPSNLRVHRPDIPVELDLLVMKLMAKKPSDRFQSATEMLAELNRIKDKLQLGTSPNNLYSDPQATVSLSAAVTGLGGSNLPDESASTGSQLQGIVRFGRSIPSLIGSVSRLKLIVPAAIASLFLGAATGWMARSPDLIKSEVVESPHSPGLWIVP